LRFSNLQSRLTNLKPIETGTSVFTFSIDKFAPVNTPTDIIFTITNANGEKWTKTLSIQISPPDHFELFQNYPNPFNPATTISYLLPAASNVSLKIFDITGREVTTLFNGPSEAGYHEYRWNASNTASGMYIYQLALTNSDGKKELYRKKMLVVK